MSARKLRRIFEELPDTTEGDSEISVWSPNEKPIHTRTWKDKGGRSRCSQMTELEAWFVAFSDARNAIVHEGKVPDLTYWWGGDRESCESEGVWRSSGETDEAAWPRLGHRRSRLVRIVDEREGA